MWRNGSRGKSPGNIQRELALPSARRRDDNGGDGGNGKFGCPVNLYSARSGSLIGGRETPGVTGGKMVVLAGGYESRWCKGGNRGGRDRRRGQLIQGRDGNTSKC